MEAVANNPKFAKKVGVKSAVDKLTQPVNLTENEWHEIEALEDNTVFINVFSDINNK